MKEDSWQTLIADYLTDSLGKVNLVEVRSRREELKQGKVSELPVGAAPPNMSLAPRSSSAKILEGPSSCGVPNVPLIISQNPTPSSRNLSFYFTTCNPQCHPLYKLSISSSCCFSLLPRK
jgi:hypothetical protein